MPSTTNATATIHTLRNIFSTHGLPVHLVSDNGPPFTSAELKTFMKQKGIYHIRTPPFHPASNGAAEKAVQTFKRALQKDTATVPLKHKLANFLLSYRTTPHSATGQAPCIMLMHRSIQTRLDLVYPSLTDVISRHQKSQCPSHDNSQPLRRFAVGDTVLARDYRTNQAKWSEETMTQVLGPLTSEVYLPDTQLKWKRHTDQLVHCPSSTASPTNTTDSLVSFPSVACRQDQLTVLQFLLETHFLRRSSINKLRLLLWLHPQPQISEDTRVASDSAETTADSNSSTAITSILGRNPVSPIATSSLCRSTRLSRPPERLDLYFFALLCCDGLRLLVSGEVFLPFI